MEAAARQFDADRDVLLNILENANPSILTEGDKSIKTPDIDWQQVSVDVRQYLLNAGEQWRSVFIPILRGLMIDQAEQWRRVLERVISIELGEQFDVRDLYAEEWMIDYAMPFSEAVLDTTGDDLNVLLTEALQQGWSIPQTQKYLRLLFEQYVTGEVPPDQLSWFTARLPARRTEMIARTESIRSSSRASQRLYEEWQVEYKQWWATPGDERTCPFCMALHGKIIPTGDAYFPQGGRMNVEIGEGDARRTASLSFNYEQVNGPPAHVFCRCSLIPVSSRWSGLGVEGVDEFLSAES